MSKMDALRAMREARYAEDQLGKQPARPARRTPSATADPTPAPVVEEAAGGDDLCGHRNMSGRTCTRESGHAAKSHRYS